MVGVIRRKPVLTYPSIVYDMLASVNSVKVCIAKFGCCSVVITHKVSSVCDSYVLAQCEFVTK